jgi:hypothetical protein
MQFVPNVIIFACGALLSLLLVLLQMVIDHPFDRFACGICELHAKPIMSAIYRWENLFDGTFSGIDCGCDIVLYCNLSKSHVWHCIW